MTRAVAYCEDFSEIPFWKVSLSCVVMQFHTPAEKYLSCKNFYQNVNLSSLLWRSERISFVEDHYPKLTLA